MNPAAILLVTLSAVFHAAWNLLSKREHPTAAFFLAANTAGCLLLLPLVIAVFPVYGDFPIRVWVFIACTGPCMAVYYIGLAGAYRHGDISVAYPLARSSPIIVVTVASLVLGRGNQISGLCVAGVILVVAGSFFVPLHRFRDMSPRRYLTPTCALALLAALGTAGYSILDDEALRLLRNHPGIRLDKVRITLSYAFAEALSANLWLVAFNASSAARRRDVRHMLRRRKRVALLAGLAIYGTYALVLVAMAHAQNVSYVVAFRQLSIPLGAVGGVLLLKEPSPVPRIVGVLVILAGLVLVASG